MSYQPIGIFDSGVGGLTVYRALRELLPYESFVYLGDTARLPYGPKSPDLVTQYSLQITARLRQENIKLLVVACNTATARALPTLRAQHPDLPIIGVVEPGARAAIASTRNNNILVLATAGTIQSKAYDTAIRAVRPHCAVKGLACGILVAMVEEGWIEGAETEAVIARYLDAVQDFAYDTVVLGCTHFPLLRPSFRRLLPPKVAIVDSAATTAAEVAAFLQTHQLQNHHRLSGQTLFLVTDGEQRFHVMAAKFLELETPLTVETVDLDQELPSLAVA